MSDRLDVLASLRFHFISNRDGTKPGRVRLSGRFYVLSLAVMKA
ncbi:hypothetical protein ES702_03123 [subsurface metagenome]